MKNWKIGTLTAGCLLILTGILLLIHLFIPLPIYKVFTYIWPVICIALGAEILLLHFMKKEANLRFSFVSIFLLIIVTFTSLGYFFASSVMNEFGISFKTHKQEINDSITLAEKVDEIFINIPSASIQIEGTDTNKVTVQGMAYINGNTKEESAENFAENYTFKQIGNKFYLSLKKQLDNFDFDRDTKQLITVFVPKNIAMHIDTSHSDVSVKNHDGTIKVNTHMGTFQAENINGTLLSQNSHGNAILTNVSLTGDSYVSATNITAIFNDKQNGKIDASIQSDGELAGNVNWQTTKDGRADSHTKGTTTIGSGEHNVRFEVQHGTISVSK
ncbi:hypothetical protein [Priestia taiwanensis]|uniref:Adhesin domain-containing protein n=1 Tax=Priestia taiwanensis TaxID=1347902 RepID=A0A917AJY3_9BACI|nr:hypothetical protein [Priestia taiwanensis]MBM7361853.1 hypothetical protein [Priestia taiwanensis]GGE57429.1 hypothetical protein GCM10007140_04790 [Priestia taiwanensis]